MSEQHATETKLLAVGQHVRITHRLVAYQQRYIKAIEASGSLVELLFKPIDGHYPGSTREKCKEKYTAADMTGRRELIMFILLSEGQSLDMTWGTPDPAKTRQHILDVAEGLRVKLPAEWDRAPEPEPATKTKTKRGAK